MYVCTDDINDVLEWKNECGNNLDELEELYETYYCLEEALYDLKHLADDVADEFYLVLLDDFTGEFVTVHKYVKMISFKEVTGEQICG